MPEYFVKQLRSVVEIGSCMDDGTRLITLDCGHTKKRKETEPLTSRMRCDKCPKLRRIRE